MELINSLSISMNALIKTIRAGNRVCKEVAFFIEIGFHAQNIQQRLLFYKGLCSILNRKIPYKIQVKMLLIFICTYTYFTLIHHPEMPNRSVIKPTIRSLNVCHVAVSIIFFLLLPFFSYSQAFFGVSSTPTDNTTHAGPTAAIVPPASMVAGDLVVIYSEYRANAITLSMSVTGGQTWTTATNYNPGSNESTYITWCTFNGTWAANPTVTAGAGNTNGLTAVMYVFTPSNSSTLWGVHIAAANSTSATNPNSITGVTTTSANTVTMAFWGSSATNTWGTLAGGGGWTKASLSAQIRNTTTGQSQTAAYNIQAAAATIPNVSQVQSAGTTAARTIISWYERGNDDCSAATVLTPGNTCTPFTDNVINATYTGLLTDCSASTPVYDVWYKFVATSVNPTITLTVGASGSNITTPRMQVFSGTCGAFSSIACTSIANPGTGSITATGLTIGNTYYIRVYSLNGTAPTTNGTFTICVVDSPDNDDCATATSLTSGTTCPGATTGTLLYAVPTAGVPGCGSASSADVWYSFVAQTAYPVITLNNIGANLNTASGRIQLLSGTCGVWSSLACVTTSGTTTALNTATTPGGAGLTVGSTYYIRISTNTATGLLTSGTYGFDVCVTDPLAARIDYSKSYVNITKGLNGGTVDPGDTLEIRATFVRLSKFGRR